MYYGTLNLIKKLRNDFIQQKVISTVSYDTFHYRTQANEVNWGFTMLVVTRAGNLIEWLQRELLKLIW